MKTISQIIAEAAPRLAQLRATLVSQVEGLNKLKARAPDAAEFIDKAIAELDEQIAILDTAADPALLFNLGLTVLNEIKALKVTGLQPVSRPSDVTGG